MLNFIINSISARFKPYLRGIARGNRAIAHDRKWRKWNDRKWRHRKQSWPEGIGSDLTEVCSAHARIFFRVFFSYYISSTKCTIAHDRHGYGCDVTGQRHQKWRHETGSGGFPLLFSDFFRFFVMLCSTPRVLSITSAFSLWYFY